METNSSQQAPPKTFDCDDKVVCINPHYPHKGLGVIVMKHDSLRLGEIYYVDWACGPRFGWCTSRELEKVSDQDDNATE